MKSQVLREALFFSISAILGPILFFGGFGYILDKHFGTEKVFLISSLGFAFITTQLFMFRKVREFSKVSHTLGAEAEQKRSAESLEQEPK